MPTDEPAVTLGPGGQGHTEGPVFEPEPTGAAPAEVAQAGVWDAAVDSAETGSVTAVAEDPTRSAAPTRPEGAPEVEASEPEDGRSAAETLRVLTSAQDVTIAAVEELRLSRVAREASAATRETALTNAERVTQGRNQTAAAARRRCAAAVVAAEEQDAADSLRLTEAEEALRRASLAELQAAVWHVAAEAREAVGRPQGEGDRENEAGRQTESGEGAAAL